MSTNTFITAVLKNRKSAKCSEQFVREEDLDRQLSREIKKFALPENWAKQLSRMADEDEQKLAQSSASFIVESRLKLENINIKIQRLLDAYLEQDIEREIYRAEKAKLISAKRTLEEKITEIERGQNHWLEPLPRMVKRRSKYAGNRQKNRSFRQKIIRQKNLRLEPLAFRQKNQRIAQNQWAALAAAHEKIGLSPENTILVPPAGIGPAYPA